MSAKGVPLSPEHRAKISAANLGKHSFRLPPHTPEARAKISAGRLGKGRPISAEQKAKLSLAFKGRRLSPETKARISASRMGIGKNCAPSAAQQKHLDAMSAALKGKKQSPEHVAKRSAAHVGMVRSAETRAKMSRGSRESVAAGRRPHLLNPSVRYTKLAQALHAHLTSTGLTLEPEVRFGRFTVDLYDREHHIAYEADGAYWHKRAEKETPGCGARRDEYLLQFYGLKVVHFTDNEIATLTKTRAGVA